MDVHPGPEQQPRGQEAEAAQVARATTTCLFEHMGALGTLRFLFLPKSQQFETIIANFPSCEM